MSHDDAAARKDFQRRLTILAALWLFVLLLLIAFRSVVTLFAGAALIAYLIAPLVDRLGRISFRGHTLPRWVAILGVYFVFFLLVYLFMVGLLPQLYRELAKISREALGFLKSLTPDRVQELARTAEVWLSARGIPVALAHHAPGDGGWSLTLNLAEGLQSVAERTSGLLEENLGSIVAISRSIVAGLLAAVFMLFFILMVAAFFTLDSTAIRAYCGTLVPAELAGDVRVLVGRIDRSLAGVVRGQVIICLVNGVLTFLGLVLLKVKFAVLLATVATVFSLIPIFGSILSSIPIVLIGLSQSWGTGLGALGWIVGIHALEAYFLNPKIMGSAARIHPVVVAFSLIAGERTFGLLGALFAVPVAAIVVACFDFARQKAQLSPRAGGQEPTGEPAKGVRIRPIQPSDDTAVARIIRQVMPEFGAKGEGFAINDPEVDYMSRAYGQPGHAYFVVELDGRVVGGGGVGALAGGDGRTCELRKMYFLPEARGRGVGAQLLRQCLTAARELGYATCYIETLGTMEAAQRLYEREGFKRLDAPMGKTGHFGCNRWYARDLSA